MYKAKKNFDNSVLNSKQSNFSMKAALCKEQPRDEETSLDVTTNSYVTANQSPDKQSFSRTQLTD